MPDEKDKLEDKQDDIMSLEECVFRNYEPTNSYCKGCDGYNYNCINYSGIMRDKKYNRRQNDED
jgi:hypothetical protein